MSARMMLVCVASVLAACARGGPTPVSVESATHGIAHGRYGVVHVRPQELVLVAHDGTRDVIHHGGGRAWAELKQDIDLALLRARQAGHEVALHADAR